MTSTALSTYYLLSSLSLSVDFPSSFWPPTSLLAICLQPLRICLSLEASLCADVFDSALIVHGFQLTVSIFCNPGEYNPLLGLVTSYTRLRLVSSSLLLVLSWTFVL